MEGPLSIGAVRGRRVACGAAGVVVMLAAAAGAGGELSQQSKANRTEARADVAQQLDSLSLPSGATAMDSTAQGSLILREFLFPYVPEEAPFYVNRLSDEQFWQVPQPPSSLTSWLRAHPPSGSSLVQAGQTTTRSDAPVWYLTFAFPHDPRHVVQRAVQVVVKRKRNGDGSVLGAGSQAVWLLTRPAWDYAPTSARQVTGTRTYAGSRSTPVTFASQQTVSRIVASINRARVLQPEHLHCKKGFPETVRLAFRARDGGPGADGRRGKPHRVPVPAAERRRSQRPAPRHPLAAQERLRKDPVSATSSRSALPSLTTGLAARLIEDEQRWM